MESQKTKILNMLLDNSRVCVTEMMAAYIPDYRRRLVDLRQDGYILEGRPCKQHDHRSKNLKEWHLISREEKREETIPFDSNNPEHIKGFDKMIKQLAAQIPKDVPQGLLIDKELYQELKEISQASLF